MATPMGSQSKMATPMDSQSKMAPPWLLSKMAAPTIDESKMTAPISMGTGSAYASMIGRHKHSQSISTFATRGGTSRLASPPYPSQREGLTPKGLARSDPMIYFVERSHLSSRCEGVAEVSLAGRSIYAAQVKSHPGNEAIFNQTEEPDLSVIEQRSALTAQVQSKPGNEAVFNQTEEPDLSVTECQLSSRVHLVSKESKKRLSTTLINRPN
ncbi:unnamed protein product [Cyprideis torosa]|uniref:Uncharacterized protein n=1 Tax=Cyprideis torosa TaxID=163714 RepID=A0A7R8WK16_9CRUS|nr:unnamed protein product [Cyprideis torosa]CAG0896390.1 unnamed protein product [Cyprideis torosa]